MVPCGTVRSTCLERELIERVEEEAEAEANGDGDGDGDELGLTAAKFGRRTKIGADGLWCAFVRCRT